MKLTRLSKSSCLAMTTLFAMLHSCALPVVKPSVAPTFQKGDVAVRRVVILPVDLGVTKITKDELIEQQPELQGLVIPRMLQGLRHAMEKRGYDVQAMLQNTTLETCGDHADVCIQTASLMHPANMAGIRLELHRLAEEKPAQQGAYLSELSTSLLQQLGQLTDSDASLYARGWAHIDPHAKSDAGQVLAAIFFIIVLIGMIAAIAGSSSGSGKKGKKSRKHHARSRRIPSISIPSTGKHRVSSRRVRKPNHDRSRHDHGASKASQACSVPAHVALCTSHMERCSTLYWP